MKCLRGRVGVGLYPAEIILECWRLVQQSVCGQAFVQYMRQLCVGAEKGSSAFAHTLVAFANPSGHRQIQFLPHLEVGRDYHVSNWKRFNI